MDPSPAAVAFPEVLETHRLVLSRPTDADLPDLLAVHTDPRVMAHLGGVRTPAEADAVHRRLFDRWARDGFGYWVARDRRTDEFVGLGGLRRADVEGTAEVEVGFALAHQARGRGLASELAREAVRVGFGVLGLAAVVAITRPDNAASRRVIGKAGLGEERAVHQARHVQILYRLRRSDWAGWSNGP
jgi:[ribosomal protein S5]-alanine N-acetyltransferase